MCGRYTLHQKTKILAKRFDVKQVPPEEILPNYNVAPRQYMPVITQGEQGKTIEFMRWGIPRFIGPGKVKEVINTRDDKAFKSWKKLVMTQRVLIPADGFYEFDKILDNGKKVQKQPYYFHPKQLDLFAFAGVWATWKDDKTNELIKTYSIITTEANKEMARIHDRMPVILHQEDEASWLEPSHDNDQSALERLLHPYEDDGLDVVEVSRDVNNARNNYSELIYPIGIQ